MVALAPDGASENPVRSARPGLSAHNAMGGLTNGIEGRRLATEQEETP
jgi:hypothetical protein